MGPRAQNLDVRCRPLGIDKGYGRAFSNLCFVETLPQRERGCRV
jgi:hypothetical protein